MVKKNNNDGIDYNDVKKYATITGVNVVGKKKAVAVVMVLDGIVAHYKKARAELSLDELKEGPELEKAKEVFEGYKKKNDDMLSWFNVNKEYDPEDLVEDSEQEKHEEPDEREKPEREEAGPEGVREESEPEKDLDDFSAEKTEKEFKEVGRRVEVKTENKEKKPKGKAKKDLAGTKDGIKKAKAEAKEKKAEAEKKKAGAGVSGESSAVYIPRFRKMLENPNTLPSKIREYIKKKGEISYADLRKACVDKLGCKSETSGPIGASVRVLELDGLIRFEGKGTSKRIIAV